MSVIVPEPTVKAVLEDAGVPVPRGVVWGEADPAGLRPPLVLKGFGPRIVHKTDVGAVRLGLDLHELPGAVRDMAGRVEAAGFLVEEQVAPGLELLVGVVRTPFGLAVTAGLGGTLVELLDDVALQLVPVDPEQLVSGFRASPALAGVRGGAPVDRAALVELVRALVGVAEGYGERFLELECNPVICRPDGVTAVDARLLLAPDAPEPSLLPPPGPLPLDALVRPRSIAVVGASSSRPGFGNRALAAYRAFGWERDLWAVHPTATAVDGVPAVASLAEVPGGVDYALVAVPAAACAGVVAGAAGAVRVAHVVSGGFGEAGGSDHEQALLHAARTSGVRVLGPNCIGVYAPAGRQTFQLGVPEDPGGVAVLSQSGGLAGDVVKAGAARGLRFSGVVSLGNAVDVGMGELVDALATDGSSRVLGLYVEGGSGGEHTVEALRRLRGRVPVVLLVGGASAQGARAAASHTGALAGDRRLWGAVADAAGATLVDDLDRFLGALVHLDRFLDHPAGGDPATLVVGVGGGASVLATDACDAAGLAVSQLDRALVQDLRAQGYGAGTSVLNPVEVGIGPAAPDDVLTRVLDPILAAHAFPDVLVHLNVQAYYGFGTGGIAPLLAHLDTLRGDRWPRSRLTVVLRNLDVAPPEERDAAVAASPVPAYRSFGDAASAIAATKRFARVREELRP